ncbi:hypothetical protein CHUAL_001226 [Chamberlinius hualienensis]
MLLKSALEGQVKSKLIVIEDNANCSAFPLLIQFIKKVSTRFSRTDIFLLELNSEIVRDVVPACPNKIVYHSWVDVSAKDSSDDDDGYLYKPVDIFEYYTKHCVSNENKDSRAIIIDSLSHYLLLIGLMKTTIVIDKFDEYSETEEIPMQIICGLYGDAHDKIKLLAIEYLSRFIIRLQPTDEKRVTESTAFYKKLDGTVKKKVETYSISNGVITITEAKYLKTREENAAKSEEELLNSKLTFSLSLKEEEKKSRAGVVLPYEKPIQSSNSGSSGKITYEFERDDDFDDDDPDCDLDI